MQSHTYTRFMYIRLQTHIYISLFIWLHWLLAGAHGSFSCGVWDLAPWLGIKPRPLALGAWSLSHWAPREVPIYIHIYVHINDTSGVTALFYLSVLLPVPHCLNYRHFSVRLKIR